MWKGGELWGVYLVSLRGCATADEVLYAFLAAFEIPKNEFGREVLLNKLRCAADLKVYSCKYRLPTITLSITVDADVATCLHCLQVSNANIVLLKSPCQ